VHPNVLRLLDAYACTPARLVFEHGGEDLRTLYMCSEFHPADTPGVIRQVLHGCAYFHGEGVIHADLQPSKILVDPAGKVRISDFSGARIDRPGCRHEITAEVAVQFGLHVGALPYRAIEILLGHVGFNCKADVWSVGCIMAEVALKRVLFQGESVAGMLSAIFGKVGGPDSATGTELTELCACPDWAAIFQSRLEQRRWTVPDFAHLGRGGPSVLQSLLTLSPTRHSCQSSGRGRGQPTFVFIVQASNLRLPATPRS